MCRQESRPNSQRQRGAVMILFGASLFVLFGFMALVVDLGRTYVVRTELQNAADAAALAGAKDLDQTAAGVTNAVARAKAIALQNNFKFSTPVNLDTLTAIISVGSCPLDSCMVVASTVTTDARAAGRTFLKVDIPSGGLTAFFGGFVGVTSTSTYGRAVAGRFLNEITPIGICAIQNAVGASRPKGEALVVGTNEFAQFGFRRGVGYNIFNLGPLGTSSTPYLINPVDSYPNTCDGNNSSTAVTAPFICGGSSAVLSTTSGTVYGNTGVSATPIERALNSRFGDYSGGSVCIPALAPPDINVTSYGCTHTGSGSNPCPTAAADWMAPINNQTIIPTGISLVAGVPPAGITDKNSYGVLWSYSRAVSALSTNPNPCALTDPCPAGPDMAASGITLTAINAIWANLYPAAGGPPAAGAAYPTTVSSPYLRDSNTGNPGLADRRVLNLAIVDCPKVIGTGNCTQLPVLGIGRFFMQVPANITAKNLQVEFAGLIKPIPVADIKLYQ